MVLRCVKKSIYEGLVQYIIRNGICNQFDAFIRFNIPVDNDIFQLTIYPEGSNKKRYLCAFQAVRMQKTEEKQDYVNLQLITSNKMLENLVNILISDYMTSQFRSAVSSM